MKNSFLSSGVALGSMVLLFVIGNLFNLSLLSFEWIYVNEPDQFQMEMKGGFIPVAVGLIAGFLTDYLLTRKEKKKRKHV